MLPLTGIFADRLQGRRVPPRRVSMGLFAAQGALRVRARSRARLPIVSKQWCHERAGAGWIIRN